MLSYDVKFITTNDSLQIKNNDFKSYKCHNKKKSEETVYDVGKRTYYERRGGEWRPSKQRQIRLLESKMRDRNVVFSEWSNDNLITLVFSNGAIAYLTIKGQTLDFTQILFDKYCIGKLAGQITGVIKSKSHLMFTHTDRMATLISFGKPIKNNQPTKIADRDPHLQTIELSGGSRKIERKVSWCEHGTGIRILVWSATSSEPTPWSPTLEDIANLHLYYVQGQQISLVAYHQLENETLCAELANDVIHVVELNTNQKNGVSSLDWLRYEVTDINSKISKLSSPCESGTHVTLPAPARFVNRSPCGTRLLAACIDGTLHVVHHTAGILNSTRVGFVASSVRWCGSLAVCGGGAALWVADGALQPLPANNHTCLDIATLAPNVRQLQILASHNFRGGSILLVTFSGGPLTLVRLKHPELIMGWLRAGQVGNAVRLLQAVDWEREGARGLAALDSILRTVLRKPLNAAGEAVAEASVGAYLCGAGAAGGPGPRARRYGPPVNDLARKFFHHLLRRGRIEKALSLGVDLRAWDLFADARWAAAATRQHALAREAAQLAAQYANIHDSDCSESCSQCSSQSYSDSEDSSASEPEAQMRPPPLPRVAPPHDAHNNPQAAPTPTIVPVPLTQPDHRSTASIRPNLHQYLERDSTIWNTVATNQTESKHDTHRRFQNANEANLKWLGVDNLWNRIEANNKMATINESRPLKSISDVRFEHQTDLQRQSYQTQFGRVPKNLYRYQTDTYKPDVRVEDRTMRSLNEFSEKVSNRTGERNKVKFSDTVTVAVMQESLKMESRTWPCPSAELAASLPVCAPDRYLAAFAPAQPPQSPAQPQSQPASHDNEDKKEPKIKIVHFGMV